MVKRKCGTCRYFQDAEIACSGWCTHPDRGDLHDLVLVRRAELACRNSWDQDLWEASTTKRRASDRPEVDRNRVPHPAVLDNPTDRVTSIDIARPQGQPERDRTAPRHPAVAGGQGTRVMIEPESERSDSNDERNNGVSSLEPSFQRALFTRPGAIQSQLETRKHDAGAFVVPAASSLPQNPPEPTGLRDQGQRDIVRAPADDTTPLPVGAINEALNSQASEELRTRKDGQSPTGANSAPVVHVDVVTTETRATPDSFSPVTEERHDSPAVISPLDQTPWVAAIPRCCDTCREFQRDPDGKTGYCGSPYAMGKRTMVKSDQLACRSSIGVWWLPSDDTWLDRADISHHTRPTPYLDAVLGDLRPGSR